MASQKGRGAQEGGFVIVQKRRGAVRGATVWLQEASEALRVANDCLLRSYGCHLAAAVVIATLVVTDKVMETAALNVTKAAGGGSLGLKDVAMREVHSPTMVQTVVAQIGQGLRIMCFLFHTLMILQFFAYKDCAN